MIKYVTNNNKSLVEPKKYCSMMRIYMSEPSEESSQPAVMKVGVDSEL